MIPIGSLDWIETIVGERGMGKSTLAILEARDFQRQTGGYVIGHSPNGQIGQVKDVKFYDKMEGWFGLQRGLKRHPELMHFLTTGNAEQLLDFADRLSFSVRKSAHRREGVRFREHRPAPKGLLAPPVLAVIDEGTSLKRNPSNDEIERLERLLVNARHKHLGLIWSTQAPNSRQWLLLEQSSKIRLFRYSHEWGANGLRAAGIDKDVALRDIKELDRFQYFAKDKANLDEGEFRSLPGPA